MKVRPAKPKKLKKPVRKANRPAKREAYMPPPAEVVWLPAGPGRIA